MSESSMPEPGGLDVALQIARNLRSQPAKAPRPKKWQRSTRAAEPETVGEVFSQVVEEQGWGTELNLRLLLTRWSELVGPTNAAHSKPEGFKDGVLFVRTESTTWATALRSIAPVLLARLNESLGQGSVARVEIKGPAAPSWKHGSLSVRNGRGPRDTYG